MTLADVLAKLEPVQRRAVRLVYLDGRSSSEAAAVLAVERAAVLAALTLAFRLIARALRDDVPVAEQLDDDASTDGVRAFPPAEVRSVRSAGATGVHSR